MEVTCPCGTTFEARDRRRKYHSPTCSERYRKRRQRGGQVVELPAVPTPDANDVATGVLAATARELTEAGRLDTALGQACLTLARRLDSPGVDTGSAMASVAARLDDLLAKATKGAGKATSAGQMADELAERRAKHG